MLKPRTVQQAQLLSNISKDTGLPIVTIRKILTSYEKEARNDLMDGKKVPLPGGMGYIYLALTTSKSRTIHLDLTDSEVTLDPKLKTVSSFSKPWKEYIQNDSRAPELIKKLIKKKCEEE